MLEGLLLEIWNAIEGLFAQLLELLGFEGELGRVETIFIVLAGLGAFWVVRRVLRFLIGGGGGGYYGGGYGYAPYGGESSINVPPRQIIWKGISPRAYLANPQLSNFSVDPNLYDFRAPSPIPPQENLETLRKPFVLDLEGMRKMHLPALRTTGFNLNWGLARKLFIGGPPEDGS